MVPAKTEIGWSYSNAHLYESCPRSLFYRHWQQSREDSSSAFDDERGHQALTAPGALIGRAVHIALADHIDRWAAGQQTGMKITQNVARDHIRDTASADVLPASIASPQELIDTTDAHIQRFFQSIWSAFTDHHYILHEETRSVDVGAATLWVRPDLCTRHDGKLYIIDWKTRQPLPFEDPSTQLQAYALWAHQTLEPDVDRILPRLVFTSTGRIDPQLIDEASLVEIRNQIITDVQTWGDPNDRAAFPPDPAQAKCSDCQYLSSCPDGRTVVDDA